jgi:hypothetical protein
MKKLFFLLVAGIVLMGPAMAMAAGSVTVTKEYLSLDEKVLILKLACVGDAANGSVPATTIGSNQIGIGVEYYLVGFYLYDMWVEVGATAPDAANIAITDSYGRTLYPDTEIIPASGTAEATVSLSPVVAPITVTQTNQSTASATWDVYILLAR